MGDPTLADVLAKLDELQRAVASLHAAVVEGRDAPAGPPARSAAAGADGGNEPRRGEAPASPVAGAAAGTSPATEEAEPLTTGPGAADSADGEEDEPPVPRPSDGPEEVIRLMFSAALRESEEESWPFLMALTHSRDLENPRALDYLKAFNWRKLRRSLDRYLVDRDAASFHIVRTDPAEIGDAEYVKVFLHQQGGMPGPVHLRRDPQKGGAWLVAQISL